MKKRILAIVLSVAMVATLTPVTAFANAEALPAPGSPRESAMRMPVYTGNEPEVQAARYKALGGLAISYARNPSLKEQYVLTFKTLYPDGINQETDLSKIPAEAQVEAGRAVGEILLSYARNPSLFNNLDKESSGIKFMMPYGMYTSFNEKEGRYYLAKHDMTKEAAQVGCAHAIGSLTEAYTRNPSLKNGFETMFQDAFGGPLKYEDGKVPVEVRAALVESAGHMLLAIARNPSIDKNVKELFNKYSPVNFDELLNPDTVSEEVLNAPSIERAKMRAVGYYLIAFVRNQSVKEDLENLLDSVIKYSDQMDINKMSDEGKNGAAEIIAYLDVAYARNPALKDDLIKKINKYVNIDALKEVDAAKIAEGRMHAIAGLNVSYARNPSLRQQLIGYYMNYLGTESGAEMPYSPELKGALGEAMYGLLLGYARNPSLQLQVYNDYLRCAGLMPAQGEAITYTEKEGVTYIRPAEGYEISYTFDFKETLNELKVEDLQNTRDLDLYFRKTVSDDPSFTKGIDRISGVEISNPIDSKNIDVTHNSIRINMVNNGFHAYTCDGGVTWQTNPVFKNLVPGTTYKIGMCEDYFGGYIPLQLPEHISEVTTLCAPVFEVPGKEFKAGESVNVAINCKDHDVYYTLDGTDPTKESKKYEKPFTLDKTTTVKAIAVKGDYTSVVITEEYIETANVTFKVKNGKWSDGTAEDKTVKVVLNENKAILDKALVPEASVAENYKAEWDKDTSKEITGDTVFTCTVKAKEKPSAKVVQKELKEVPESLKETEYKTVKDIEKALEDKAVAVLKKLSADKKHKTYMFDAVLMITEDGVTRPATKEEIEARGGIKVLIPYPEGTNGKDYVFTVAHMLTVAMNGMEAGDIETPEVTLRENGIEVTLRGLSPVMVAYAEKDTAEPAVKPEDKSPSTGDNELPFMWAGILVLATGMLVLVKRKRDEE